MNPNMNSKNHESKHSKTNKSQVETAENSSSDYSTCSDNPYMNICWAKKKLQTSRDSNILAGHINADSVLEDTNFSVSPLDLNLDILSSENDVFDDCKDYSFNDSQEDECNNDSTMYLQLEQMQTQNQERLLTIIEEKEVTNTTGFTVRDLSNQNTGQLVSEMISQAQIHKEPNNNFTRKVLFVNLDKSKSLNHHPEWSVSRKVNDTCNHNTTESFVMWEKFCQKNFASENLAKRRSFSFSHLNTTSETCNGDDEYSTSYKTNDELSLSTSSLEESQLYQHKGMIRRSKSCESLLQEVKHLPHLLYDRFLQSLSKEIERIRKEEVVCTCPKFYKKNCNKENGKRKSPKKTMPKLTNKSPNAEHGDKESRLPLRVRTHAVNKTSNYLPKSSNTHLSPALTSGMRSSPEATNQTRLSPEASNRTKLSPGAASRMRLSPEMSSKNLSQTKSPIKTPTTPSKSRYFWNKQIVSPVGEYIRGKRQSPFQSSPSKKK